MSRFRSGAEVMAMPEPERTLRSLPVLPAKPGDKKRGLSHLMRRQSQISLTRKQRDMIGKIAAVLSEKEAGAGGGIASDGPTLEMTAKGTKYYKDSELN